jgi:preprotein translocase subunit SecF
VFELIPKTFYYDFIAKRHLFAGISWALWGISLALFLIVGPNWSIDFTGGTEVQVKFEKTTSIDEVRRALKPAGVSDDAIQQLGEDADNRFLFRTQGASAASDEEIAAVRTALDGAFGADWVKEVEVDAQVGSRASVVYSGPQIPVDRIEAALAPVKNVSVQSSTEENTFYVRLPGLAEAVAGHLQTALADHGMVVERTDSVGPKVGGSLRVAGALSLGITLLLMLIYIGSRFDFTFAPGAILCLFHDTIIVCGFWVITRQEFGLSMISALLTLCGYSINDTIVVYDRIRENMEKYRRQDLPKLINDSINQTLSRTLITSGGTMLSMIPFLIWGGPVLFHFAEAMLFGIVIGTYSSIYVAAPMTIVLRENREWFEQILGMNKKKSAVTATGKPGGNPGSKAP